MDNTQETEFVKISLPGETPWASIIKRIDGRRVIVRIANRLWSEYSEEERLEWAERFGFATPPPVLHNYKEGDVVYCQFRDGVLVPIESGEA